jgi:hypothetical protein
VLDKKIERGTLNIAASADIIAESYIYTQKFFNKFLTALDKGRWNTQHNLLGASDWRAMYPLDIIYSQTLTH